jgi:hypothetical protein
MDEKSLIKKYQKEISCLKQELHQLKRGMMESPYMASSTQEDLVNLKLQVFAMDFYALYNLFILVVANIQDDNSYSHPIFGIYISFCEVLYKFDN